MRDRPQSIPPDLDDAPVTEALRRELYDAVVRVAFPKHPDPDEIAPTFSPDDGQLNVFYVWGRWFAVWRDLDAEDEDHLPYSRIWQVVRIQSDPLQPEGIVFHEV
ncbi:MAG TPA: hypothetical protein VNW71_04035 [Thermoanaerobaculia bacterium]|nr:hypothetical protein [Thermoanaerobaculia bacterium]